MSLFSELLDRVKSPTPRFWKRVRNTCFAIGSAGTLILAAPQYYPEVLVGMSKYFMTAGILGTILSQMTKDTPTWDGNPTPINNTLPEPLPEVEDVEDPLL